jgi:tetratricopeptide (TPR) repeat protein
MASGETAAALLKQGRCQTACQILDTNLAAKADLCGVDSPEYRDHSIDTIHLLLDSALGFVESGQVQSANFALSKVQQLLTFDCVRLPLPEESLALFSGTACFLSASLAKQLRRSEQALQLYLEAAARFEASRHVTELCLSYVGAAHCLLKLGRDDEAVGYAINARDLLSSPDCSTAVANPVHEALAMGFLRQNRPDLAEEELLAGVQCRQLESALPKMIAKAAKSRECSSSQSVPVAPPAPKAGNMRARMMKQRIEKQQLAPSWPLRELGQLQLSVSKLVNHT